MPFTASAACTTTSVALPLGVPGCGVELTGTVELDCRASTYDCSIAYRVGGDGTSLRPDDATLAVHVWPMRFQACTAEEAPFECAFESGWFRRAVPSGYCLPIPFEATYQDLGGNLEAVARATVQACRGADGVPYFA